MTYNEFVVMVCESLGLDQSTIDEDTSFLHDLGVDSLSLANFVIKLEHRHKIKIEMNNIWELHTIREAYQKFTAACAAKSDTQKKDTE